MPTYRILYGDALAHDLLGELPAESVTFTHTLNAPGAATVKMPLRPERAGAVPTISPSSLEEGRTALYIERDGVILWAGLLWSMDGDVGTNVLNLSAEGWLSYFHRRYVRSTLAYSATDQATIAAGLIDYAQGVAGGDLGVSTADVEATGVLRDRTYWGYERKNVGDALVELAAVRNGFDFRFETAWDAGALATRLLLTYPPEGRRTDLTFEMGSNVELLSFRRDGTARATQVDALGVGEGEDKLSATAADPSLTGIVPLLEDVVSHSDVKLTSTLLGHAERRLDRGRYSLTVPTVELRPGSQPSLGSWIVGDQCRLIGSFGLLDIDGTFRITEQRVDVEAGAEAVALTFAPLEAFSA